MPSRVLQKQNKASKVSYGITYHQKENNANLSYSIW